MHEVKKIVHSVTKYFAKVSMQTVLPFYHPCSLLSLLWVCVYRSLIYEPKKFVQHSLQCVAPFLRGLLICPLLCHSFYFFGIGSNIQPDPSSGSNKRRCCPGFAYGLSIKFSITFICFIHLFL